MNFPPPRSPLKTLSALIPSAAHLGEARDRAILDTCPDAIISINPEGNISEWNPAAELIFGFTRDLVIGRAADSLLAPAAATDPAQAKLAQSLKSGKGRLIGKRTEMTAVRANGGVFPIELALTRVPESGPASFSIRITDITERKLAEAILHKSEERFRLLVEGVDYYAIYLLDPRGRILTWNAGAERIDGYRARDIIGRRFHRLYIPEDLARGKPEQALSTAGAEGRYADEGWSVRKDGSHYWASVVLTSLRHKNGSLFGYARIGGDHTQRKKAEVEAANTIRTLATDLQNRTAELQAALRELRPDR